MEDIFVNYIEMPATVRSFVIMNSDSTYTIILNSKLSHEQNIISYWHEIDHIRNGDYDKRCSADMIEIAAHKQIGECHLLL